MIINDSNWQSVLNPIVNGERKYTGYKGMWETPEKKSSCRGFKSLGIPLIDQSEWQDRIRQKERDKTRLKDFCLDMGLTVLDQGSTNYCWINAPTFCSMVIRLQELGRCIRLSPASAGARIKNFNNVGGWGTEGLDWGLVHGFNEQSDWPPNAINRSYNTPENQQKALAHRIVEYFRLNSWAEVVSCILAGIPVAVGYNWWRHEVTAMDLTLSLSLIIANSWGLNWGDYGYGILEGNKRFPDDAVAFTSLYPYSDNVAPVSDNLVLAS